MEEKAFWMIYVEGGNSPNYRHETRESALEEAKRLARNTHRKAYILESTGYMKLKDVEFHWMNTDNILFE